MEEIKRSIYSINQQYEEESRTHLKYNFNKLGWKFRDLSQDNDIDGELEIFDSIDERLDKQTSGKFIKVQIKSTKECNIIDGLITFSCPVKFLHFCDVCDTPVLLVLYDYHSKEAYWVWIQHYIYNKLDIDNTNWRNNKESVAIKFSANDVVSNREVTFETRLKDIAHNGTNEISQMRKYATFQRYYTIISEDDISTPLAKRITAKILVETSFASSREAMRILIPKINQDLMYSDHANSKGWFSSDKPCDVISMFFYNDIKQTQHGLPFCRTQWIDEELDKKPNILVPDEFVETIGVIWESMHELFSDLIPNNLLPKGQYLKLAESTYKKFLNMLININREFEHYKNQQIDFITLKKKINYYKPELDEYYNKFSERGYPPYECTELDRVLLDIISAIHDLGIYSLESERDEKSETWLISNSIERALKQLPFYDYERKKIR
ncbi:DUF4365 domain-containing protein [Paenibacillus azoreducens]|uniref:DUF4365 domain-containing protein n=1 Tax=Paenibacillus azoreducens TaxID=116718 RepID=UPI0039F4DDB6